MIPTLSRRAMLAGISALALLSPSNAFATDGHPPLRIVTSFTINDIDPTSDGRWLRHFGGAEYLIQHMADGEHVPWLLKSFEQVDPTTWTLTVRGGVRFQNGRELTAQDVLDVIEHQLETAPVARARVPEDARFSLGEGQTILVQTDSPWPELPGAFVEERAFPIFDMVAFKAAEGDKSALIGAGIYTGPYAVTALDERALVSEQFDEYWRGEPALPKVTVTFVPDANARILAVQNDEADIALYPPLAARVAVDATPGVHFRLGAPSMGGFGAFFNPRPEASPFRDPTVRRAIMKAIDYSEIADGVFGGAVTAPIGLYPASFDFALHNLYFDPEGAAELLDAAGWVRAGNGPRVRDGVPLRIRLMIYPQQPDLVPMSTAIQAQLARLGIEVSVRSVDGILQALRNDVDGYDLGIAAPSAAADGVVQGFLNDYLLPGGSNNYTGYENPEVIALVQALTVEVDLAARTEMLHRIQEIVIEEDPFFIPLNILRARAISNDRYAGYVPGFANFHIDYRTAPSP